MAMTAYARLMQMRADIEKIKALSATRQSAHGHVQDDERDLLPDEQRALAAAQEHALLPGETAPKPARGLRTTLN